MKPERTGYFALLALLLLAGAFLRANQFTDQVLLDDEWHAVHLLLNGLSPAEMFLTFGHADYSIPLGMLYWFEARWFGLSELAMRWPMLLTGLGLLLAAAVYTWRIFSPRIAVLFTLLMAFSPMLVIYSHTARPYALTLLFAYLGLYSFYRCLSGASRPLAWGIAYGASAAITIWLHPVTGPFMIAPFLVEAVRGLVTRQAGTFKKLVLPAVTAAVLVLPLIIPPLLASPEKLAGKLGQTDIGLETLQGVWFFWLGTGSIVMAGILLILFAVGSGRLFKSDQLWQSVVLGLVLTALVIVVTQPASVSNPGTFGRYLLPAIPLLLLGIACGMDMLLGKNGPLIWPARVFCILLLGVYVLQSPAHELVYRPNSQMTHSRFQADFRAEKNVIRSFQERALALSPFWSSLAQYEPGSQRVAVAPFYFETYHWDAPRWEQLGRQRIVPAFLNGFCADLRKGEVPASDLYRFRNVFYLSELDSRETEGYGWIVFTTPLQGLEGSAEGRAIVAEAGRCTARLRDILGEPEFKDDSLLAWKLQGTD